MSKRRNHEAAFKARVALEALLGRNRVLRLPKQPKTSRTKRHWVVPEMQGDEDDQAREHDGWGNPVH